MLIEPDCETEDEEDYTFTEDPHTIKDPCAIEQDFAERKLKMNDLEQRLLEMKMAWNRLRYDAAKKKSHFFKKKDAAPLGSGRADDIESRIAAIQVCLDQSSLVIVRQRQDLSDMEASVFGSAPPPCTSARYADFVPDCSKLASCRTPRRSSAWSQHASPDSHRRSRTLSDPAVHRTSRPALPHNLWMPPAPPRSHLEHSGPAKGARAAPRSRSFKEQQALRSRFVLASSIYGSSWTPFL